MAEEAGVRALILAGDGVPLPLDGAFVGTIVDIEVDEVCDGQCGFRITFQAERSQSGLGPDLAVLAATQMRPFCRVVIIVMLTAVPTVLIDGMVTERWLDGGRGGRLTVSGADLSVMMGLEDRIQSYPGQDEAIVAARLIASYARYGIIPEIVPPSGMETPLPTQRVPVQHGSDLEHLYTMADRFGYVFAVRPGPVPLTSYAYWGPRPARAGRRALSVGLGTLGNVEGLRFTHNALGAVTATGMIQDPGTQSRLTFSAKRPTTSPLARDSGFSASNIRKVLVTDTGGQTSTVAGARAQASVDRSARRVVKAEGDLNVLTYGEFLRAGDEAPVRGAGANFDGDYAVDRVVHRLAPGVVRQSFELSREGIDPIGATVTP